MRLLASTPLRKTMRYVGLKRYPTSMDIRRGDVVTVAATGDYGKPRPAVVVHSDAFPQTHDSVSICQITSSIADAQDFRVTLEPSTENGLKRVSQIMADKPTTVRRERIGSRIGRLDGADIHRLNRALAFCLGLAD